MANNHTSRKRAKPLFEALKNMIPADLHDAATDVIEGAVEDLVDEVAAECADAAYESVDGVADDDSVFPADVKAAVIASQS